VRRNGPLDGQVIGYMVYENDEAMKARNGGSRVKTELMKNAREQMAKWSKASATTLDPHLVAR
jgi:hypothetical protein